MIKILDKRDGIGQKSIINRQRFLRRFKSQIQSAVQKIVSKRSIKEIDNDEKITLPLQATNEVQFGHGVGGIRENVLAGNKSFVTGDHLPRPPSMQLLSQSKASNEGQDTDEFVFNLTREEFLHLFFEELQLPKLVRKELAELPSKRFQRAGFSSDGVPPNMSIVRTMRNAIGRKIALRGRYQAHIDSLTTAGIPTSSGRLEEIEQWQTKIKNIPLIEELDVRYNRFECVPKPSTQAVMFCIMDVSGSMDESKKEMAKRFFILLYLFLTRRYESIDVVFIRHHTIAKEVDEQSFFYSRETGGTVVSSALGLMSNLIETRYPPCSWNIYAAQASDGDNWNADSPHCQQLLINKILPYVQYYAYVEILPRQHQSLWHAYQSVQVQADNFAMQKIMSLEDIYPVLNKLFKEDHQRVAA